MFKTPNFQKKTVTGRMGNLFAHADKFYTIRTAWAGNLPILRCLKKQFIPKGSQIAGMRPEIQSTKLEILNKTKNATSLK